MMRLILSRLSAIRLPALPAPLARLPLPRIPAKLAVACVLGVVLVFELLLPGGGASRAEAPPPVPGAQGDGSADDAAIGQWANTALARPLFAPNRRPAAQAAAAATDAPPPRLSAIIITGGIRSAIFDDGGPKPVVASEGGDVAGYKLRTIQPDSVNLDGPDGPVTLRPQFAPPPPPSAPPPPPSTGAPPQLGGNST